MRHRCEFAALPARWREAKATGNPQRHPGHRRASQSVQKLLSGTVLLSIYHIRAVWTEVAETLTHGSKPGMLSLNYRLQDVVPQPRGSSHSQRLASSLLCWKGPQGHRAVRRGVVFCFSGLGFNLMLAKWPVELMWAKLQIQVIRVDSCHLGTWFWKPVDWGLFLCF